MTLSPRTGPTLSFLALALGKDPSCEVLGYTILVYQVGVGKLGCVMAELDSIPSEERVLDYDMLRGVWRFLSPISGSFLKWPPKAFLSFWFWGWNPRPCTR